MLRHYYITKDLDTLEKIESALEAKGVHTPQFHVLSEQDAEVERHHLHAIEAVLKKDVVRSTIIGAIYGVIGAALIIGTAYFTGWYTSPAGWLPFAFLAIVILGFCTWEGGLIGIQVPNRQFKRFQKLLSRGKHVFFVDFDPQQKARIEQVTAEQSRLKFAGTGDATPTWVVKGQEKFQHFMKSMP
ncbi:NAD/FAD-utilizing enzyme [Alteromonas halophila]|uniref:NAD/FAD-utilizing enzyme n=1 Tax=Alteromonas halophila TaxID=516698 RepID=A0A918JCK3_9ALTE|nr:NAD/FAD-utilizing enzyme [Alteromonas halophila]GGW74761.1 hypothetical protein GCM10007391_03510 [Alteromonas halophila]